MKLKQVSVLVVMALLVGCGSGSRPNNDTGKSSDENNTDYQHYTTAGDDRILYIDFDSGDAGVATADPNNFDLSFSERGMMGVGPNAELYRTKKIRLEGDLEDLKTAHQADPGLNKDEFATVTAEVPLERVTDQALRVLGNVMNAEANAGNWAIYAGPPSHKLYSRLALYVVKTDSDNYFVIQPLAQLPEPGAKGMSPFTSRIRVKKIEKPTAINP